MSKAKQRVISAYSEGKKYAKENLFYGATKKDNPWYRKAHGKRQHIAWLAGFREGEFQYNRKRSKGLLRKGVF